MREKNRLGVHGEKQSYYSDHIHPGGVIKGEIWLEKNGWKPLFRKNVELLIE
jgi:hypothetical protein